MKTLSSVGFGYTCPRYTNVEKQSVAFCDGLSVGLDLMDNGKTKLFTFPSGAGKSPTLLHYVRKVTVKASFFSLSLSVLSGATSTRLLGWVMGWCPAGYKIGFGLYGVKFNTVFA